MDNESAWEVMSHSARRHIVRELIENNGVSTLDDLSKLIAAHRSGPTDSKAIDHAKISLVHNHLPRLEDHGVIKHDRQDGDVRLVNVEGLKPLLEAAPEGDSTLSAKQ